MSKTSLPFLEDKFSPQISYSLAFTILLTPSPECSQTFPAPSFWFRPPPVKHPQTSMYHTLLSWQWAHCLVIILQISYFSWYCGKRYVTKNNLRKQRFIWGQSARVSASWLRRSCSRKPWLRSREREREMTPVFCLLSPRDSAWDSSPWNGTAFIMVLFLSQLIHSLLAQRWFYRSCPVAKNIITLMYGHVRGSRPHSATEDIYRPGQGSLGVSTRGRLILQSFYTVLWYSVHFFLYCFKLKSLYIGPSFLLGTKLHCTVV